MVPFRRGRDPLQSGTNRLYARRRPGTNHLRLSSGRGGGEGAGGQQAAAQGVRQQQTRGRGARA